MTYDENMKTTVNSTSNMMAHKSRPWNLCYHYNIAMFGIALPVLCLVALVGNTINIITWTKIGRWRGWNSSIVLMLYLAVIDFLNQIPTIFVICLPIIGAETLTMETYLCQYYPYFRKYIWPFATTTNFCTVWLTMLISVHRYRVLCKPFSAFTQRLTSVRAAVIQAACIMVLGLADAAPKFFEVEIMSEKFPDGSTCLYLMLADHRFSTLYNLYYITLSLMLTICAPISIIIVLTICILQLLLQARTKREEMTTNQSSTSPREAAITKTLLTIVIITTICQIPNICICMWIVINPHLEFFCGDPAFFIDPITELFIQLNSAVNVFVYTCGSRDFQAMLRHICCCAKLPATGLSANAPARRNNEAAENNAI